MFRHRYILGIIIMLLFAGAVQPGLSQSLQLYNEAHIVHLANLARREHGIPPLRWNRELTLAARRFAQDSVENRPEPYCGHEDSQGSYPDGRARTAGYKGLAGAENIFCGYVTPEQAIEGWLRSSGHAENLLNANHREVGHGYYQKDDRAYVVQAFGSDPVYPPVIIENEALTTTSTQVNLYIYNNTETSSINGIGSAVDMMIANTPTFAGSVWEPYSAEKVWHLLPGEGWKTVYVKMRDRFNRTITVNDTIYLGTNIPSNELGDAQASTTRSQVTISQFDSTGLPLLQLSPNWLVDDLFATFKLHWGNGEQIRDATAIGGTAFRLYPGNGESYAWVWTTNFIKDVPLVAYFRLKINANTSPDEVGRISIAGGGTNYGPLVLRGTDFVQPQVYQEFAIPFTFHSNQDESFLIFNTWRSGNADIYVDTVSIFTNPQPVGQIITWQFPEDNYRGQGIWLRFSDPTGGFSPLQEAIVDLSTDPDTVRMKIFLPLYINKML